MKYTRFTPYNYQIGQLYGVKIGKFHISCIPIDAAIDYEEEGELIDSYWINFLLISSNFIVYLNAYIVLSIILGFGHIFHNVFYSVFYLATWNFKPLTKIQYHEFPFWENIGIIVGVMLLLHIIPGYGMSSHAILNSFLGKCTPPPGRLSNVIVLGINYYFVICALSFLLYVLYISL